MSNLSSVSQEDLDKYPSLKGKQVGDVITAEEREALKLDEAKKNASDNDSKVTSTTPVSDKNSKK